MNAARPTVRLVAAALIYFALVFGAGFLLGPIRVLLLEPRIGALAAVLIEAPLLLAVMVIAARLAPRWSRLPGHPALLLACGLLALLLQQAADLTLGLALRGIALSAQIGRYASTEGGVYLGLLVLFAIMPWLARAGRAPRQAHDRTKVREGWWSRGESNP